MPIESVGQLNEVTTDERIPLGTRYIQPPSAVKAYGSGVSSAVTWSLLKGERTWMFVKADEALAAGQLAEWTDGAPYTSEPNDTNTLTRHVLAGVADHAIAAGSYSWVIVKGPCVALAGGSVAANGLIDADGGTTEGQVELAAGTDASVIGRSLEADGATLASYAQCYIDLDQG
jgi:hypothetical protein